MTRAAVTVFIETSHDGDAVDAAILFKHALRKILDSPPSVTTPIVGTVTVTPNRVMDPVTITVYDAMESGMAAGNGYLWLEPTSKAYPRPEAGQ